MKKLMLLFSMLFMFVLSADAFEVNLNMNNIKAGHKINVITGEVGTTFTLTMGAINNTQAEMQPVEVYIERLASRKTFKEILHISGKLTGKINYDHITSKLSFDSTADSAEENITGFSNTSAFTFNMGKYISIIKREVSLVAEIEKMRKKK